jgi:hypothetical protein
MGASNPHNKAKNNQQLMTRPPEASAQLMLRPSAAARNFVSLLSLT